MQSDTRAPSDNAESAISPYHLPCCAQTAAAGDGQKWLQDLVMPIMIDVAEMAELCGGGSLAHWAAAGGGWVERSLLRGAPGEAIFSVCSMQTAAPYEIGTAWFQGSWTMRQSFRHVHES
jgi:hypothetical protein